VLTLDSTFTLHAALQVLLATAKKEAPPLFRLLAANFRKRDAAFGWFSTELDLDVAAQFNVPRVPHLMVLHVDPAAAADAEGRVPLGMEPFTLPLKYKYMHSFLEAIVARLGRAGDQVCA
jgi:hypothetical protein